MVSRSVLFDNAVVLKLVEQRGWSVREWAKKAGVSRPTILNFIEDANNIIKTTTLDAIVKPLGLTAMQIQVGVTPSGKSPPAIRSEKRLIPA